MPPSIPRVLSSETAYEGRLFNIALDRLEMGDGVIAYRETIRHPGAVAMVPVTVSGTLLLVTQYRHAAGRRLLELPAGTLESGETPRDAVARELQEEVGYHPGEIADLGGLFVAPGYTDEYIHLFVCTDLTVSELPGDDDEDIELQELSIEAALAAIDEGTICDAKSIVGILRWLRASKQRGA